MRVVCLGLFRAAIMSACGAALRALGAEADVAGGGALERLAATVAPAPGVAVVEAAEDAGVAALELVLAVARPDDELVGGGVAGLGGFFGGGLGDDEAGGALEELGARAGDLVLAGRLLLEEVLLVALLLLLAQLPLELGDADLLGQLLAHLLLPLQLGLVLLLREPYLLEVLAVAGVEVLVVDEGGGLVADLAHPHLGCDIVKRELVGARPFLRARTCAEVWTGRRPDDETRPARGAPGGGVCRPA
ncbi:uncharacterized protein BcabD6B2_48700 [Babesia caballi]|uniref:Secreted protein n=1 Tax=Babesia caballi TaxID=5871 RepID=A0AAV4M0L7_BABCB|nr:hypothetical protein BcabD6B2_48700 [Babesia caballi]